MNRKQALDIIRIEVAKYGKLTKKAISVYVENKISGEALDEASSEGYAQYIKNLPDDQKEKSWGSFPQPDEVKPNSSHECWCRKCGKRLKAKRVL